MKTFTYKIQTRESATMFTWHYELMIYENDLQGVKYGWLYASEALAKIAWIGFINTLSELDDITAVTVK